MREPQPPTIYSFQVTEDEAMDLAAGIVPRAVKAMAIWLCEDLDAQLRRNAERANPNAVRGRRINPSCPRAYET